MAEEGGSRTHQARLAPLTGFEDRAPHRGAIPFQMSIWVSRTLNLCGLRVIIADSVEGRNGAKFRNWHRIGTEIFRRPILSPLARGKPALDSISGAGLHALDQVTVDIQGDCHGGVARPSRLSVIKTFGTVEPIFYRRIWLILV